jgi:hypothetical protein
VLIKYAPPTMAPFEGHVLGGVKRLVQELTVSEYLRVN